MRVLARDARRLQGRSWSTQVDIVQGDVLAPETLPAAMAGVWAAYYLIHSMSDSADFHQRDLVAARNFGQAAQLAGVERIIHTFEKVDAETFDIRIISARKPTRRETQAYKQQIS